MKLYLLLLFSLALIKTYSQNGSLCFVTSVKGKPAYITTGKPVKVGDAISKDDAQKNIRFKSHHEFVTLYSAATGSFRVFNNERTSGQIRNSQTPNFLEFAQELLRVHARSVPLSSRGDCDCVLPEECLSTDPTINKSLLLIDELTFPALLESADSFFYFLQMAVNGTVLNRQLLQKNGRIHINRKDLEIPTSEGSTFYDSTITLGICRIKHGVKKVNSVTKLQLTVVDSSMLKNYYTSLAAAMLGIDRKQLFKEFCTDIYLFYGKPNICALQKLVGYVD